MSLIDGKAGRLGRFAPPSDSARIVFSILFVYVAAAALVAAYADRSGPIVSGLSTLFAAGTSVAELATSFLLLARFREGRRATHLLLACAYLYSALMAIAYLLTFPGSLLPGLQVVGGATTVSWIFIPWLVGFSLMSFGIAALAAARPHDPPLSESGQEIIWPLIAAAVALGIFLVAVLAAPILPPLLDGGRWTSIDQAASWSALALLLGGIALILAVVRESDPVLVWFSLAMAGLAFADFVSTLGGARYSVGWTAARISWLISANILFLYFIVHFTQQQRRLAAARDALTLRTRERDQIWKLSEDLLGVTDFEGRILSVNPAWRTLLGWSEEEIRSMSVSDLRHPEDAASAAQIRADLRRGAVSNARMLNRFRHKNGSWRWLAWTITADDGLLYISGRHVTNERALTEALHENERQFQILVAGVTDYAMLMLDANGVVTSWNSGAERIKGYRADEVIGRHFSLFYTEMDRQAGRPSTSLATAAKEGRFEAEGWRVRRDGTLFWANVVIDAIHDDEGKLIGFAKITRDITERREAQIALSRVQAERAQLQKMDALGQLTGGVAHDFNNLLMIIAGHIRMIKREIADLPKAMRAADAIDMATQRGETLTRQLLSFARRHPVNPILVNLRERIDEIYPILASSAGSRISVRLELAEDLCAVKLDPHELELALINATLNSRDAMPNGGAISIRARNVRYETPRTPAQLVGDFVEISIADEGQGIPPDLLPKVFDPFFTTKPIDKGTGLGLSQVHGFAHQSGGAATISSEINRGTTLTLHLPRASEAAVREAAPKEEAKAIGSGRVLLVEDNKAVADVTRDMLIQLGYEVDTEPAPERALELIDDSDYDLVVSDILMPGDLDGLQLACAIRDRRPGLPILLVTGYAECAARAATEFPVLRKPFQIDALHQMIAGIGDHDAVGAHRS